MPEIGASGLMSGGGKRGVGHRPQATAPILDSTEYDRLPGGGAPACYGHDRERNRDGQKRDNRNMEFSFQATVRVGGSTITCWYAHAL
jgi:hypothetical protein